MNKRTIIFITILLNTYAVMAQSSRDTKMETLNVTFAQKDWKAFAETFPETFTELMDLYGYKVDSSSNLYHEGWDHVMFLFSDDRIREECYLQKILVLTEGFYWDADVTSYLGYEVQQMLEMYPDLISKFMEDKPDRLVKDFLKCAIATPHPEPENTLYYNQLLEIIGLYEERSSKIVRLIRQAHQELMYEWCE